jgi:hypothetical protein
MPGTYSGSNPDPEQDAEVRATEADLRALLRPGGSTDRVWHLVEFSAGYEAKQASRLASKETEQRSRRQIAKLYSRSLRLARSPHFRIGAIAAVVLMTMAVTQPLTDTDSAPAHLSYTVRADEQTAVADQAQMTNIIMALSSEHPQERENAEQAVIACGPRILPLLTPLLKSNDPELKKRAEQLIARVSRPTTPQ